MLPFELVVTRNFLIVFGILIFLVSLQKLPETLKPQTEKLPSVFAILCKLAKDKKVIGFGLLVAICNGITFSYYAEGSFYLIELLGLSPSQYGTTFIFMASATIIGSIISRKMQTKIDPLTIINYGLWTMLCSNGLLCIGTLFQNTLSISKMQLLMLTIGVMMGNMAGVCMVTSNSLAQALQNYRHAIGTASSLFGFSYYLGVSLCTFGMGLLHNGTAIPMPLYFFSLSLLMICVFKTLTIKAPHDTF